MPDITVWAPATLTYPERTDRATVWAVLPTPLAVPQFAGWGIPLKEPT